MSSGSTRADEATPARLGLPLTRSYALGDIGDASRVTHLGFDPAGRLTVVSGDGYFVLNDSIWLNRMHDEDRDAQISRIETDAEGRIYFGALANWGLVDSGPDGRFRLRSLRPESAPSWVASTSFYRVIPHARGALFAGFNGMVNWDRASGKQTYFATTGITALFVHGSQVFVSSYSGGTRVVDLEHGTLSPAAEGLGGTVVDCAVSLDNDHLLVASIGRRMLLCDASGSRPWGGSLPGLLNTRVSAMERLPDGGIAVAFDGKGLFLLSPDGTPRMTLTSTDYHRIQDLAAGEPGVLWVATESSVHKVLYGSAVRVIDQRLGVLLRWPHLVSWQGRIYVSSSGQMFESGLGEDGVTHRFSPVPGLPEHGAWGAAAAGPHLLIANKAGVFVREGDGFQPVVSDMDVNQVVMIGTDFCYVIGVPRIAALRYVDGRWVEAAPRIPGVGFPAIVHRMRNSVWIEIGMNHVARVSYSEGRLHARAFEDFPWKEPRWINLGLVGDTVILNGGPAGAIFFSETTGDFCDAPELRNLIEHAPFPVTRLAEDDRGWIWVTHDRGVFVAHRDASQPSGFRFDTAIAQDLRDYQPRVDFLAPDHIAISTDRTLYLVERDSAAPPPAAAPPLLAAIVDRRSGEELYSIDSDTPVPARLSYGHNSLLFRFFSGSYRSLRPVEYEYSLVGGSSNWTTRDPNSHLDLRDLTEGSYRLTARVIDDTGPAGRPPLAILFQVAPPWYRSPTAYAGYAMLTLLAAWGILSWALSRARRRNAALEDLVRERTEELRSTMTRLGEETRTTAIYAERTRLAGEIHDSVQQGLSGMMLQLGVTLKLPELPPEVKSKLEVVRNMVSFTRHEVQQAVWNLESPLLESTALPEALAKLASLIGSGTPRIQVETHGNPTSLPSTTKHNLLRIAQEAITNAVRHGNARTIQVTLTESADRIRLEVRDDGDGFAPREALDKNAIHFGLRGMRARASRIGATFEITSAPGAGTTVGVTLPLAAEAASIPHATPP